MLVPRATSTSMLPVPPRRALKPPTQKRQPIRTGPGGQQQLQPARKHIGMNLAPERRTASAPRGEVSAPPRSRSVRLLAIDGKLARLFLRARIGRRYVGAEPGLVLRSRSVVRRQWPRCITHMRTFRGRLTAASTPGSLLSCFSMRARRRRTSCRQRQFDGVAFPALRPSDSRKGTLESANYAAAAFNRKRSRVDQVGAIQICPPGPLHGTAPQAKSEPDQAGNDTGRRRLGKGNETGEYEAGQHQVGQRAGRRPVHGQCPRTASPNRLKVMGEYVIDEPRTFWPTSKPGNACAGPRTGTKRRVAGWIRHQRPCPARSTAASARVKPARYKPRATIIRFAAIQNQLHRQHPLTPAQPAHSTEGQRPPGAARMRPDYRRWISQGERVAVLAPCHAGRGADTMPPAHAGAVRPPSRPPEYREKTAVRHRTRGSR